MIDSEPSRTYSAAWTQRMAPRAARIGSPPHRHRRGDHQDQRKKGQISRSSRALYTQAPSRRAGCRCRAMDARCTCLSQQGQSQGKTIGSTVTKLQRTTAQGQSCPETRHDLASPGKAAITHRMRHQQGERRGEATSPRAGGGAHPPQPCSVSSLGRPQPRRRKIQQLQSSLGDWNGGMPTRRKPWPTSQPFVAPSAICRGRRMSTEEPCLGQRGQPRS